MEIMFFDFLADLVSFVCHQVDYTISHVTRLSPKWNIKAFLKKSVFSVGFKIVVSHGDLEKRKMFVSRKVENQTRKFSFQILEKICEKKFCLLY